MVTVDRYRRLVTGQTGIDQCGNSRDVLCTGQRGNSRDMHMSVITDRTGQCCNSRYRSVW